MISLHQIIVSDDEDEEIEVIWQQTTINLNLHQWLLNQSCK